MKKDETLNFNVDKDEDAEPDPKYGYIDEKLTQELCAINHTYIEESCDSVYSLVDMFFKKFNWDI